MTKNDKVMALLDEKNQNIDSIAFKFGILCLCITGVETKKNYPLAWGLVALKNYSSPAKITSPQKSQKIYN